MADVASKVTDVEFEYCGFFLHSSKNQSILQAVFCSQLPRNCRLTKIHTESINKQILHSFCFVIPLASVDIFQI